MNTLLIDIQISQGASEKSHLVLVKCQLPQRPPEQPALDPGLGPIATTTVHSLNVALLPVGPYPSYHGSHDHPTLELVHCRVRCTQVGVGC